MCVNCSHNQVCRFYVVLEDLLLRLKGPNKENTISNANVYKEISKICNYSSNKESIIDKVKEIEF